MALAAADKAAGRAAGAAGMCSRNRAAMVSPVPLAAIGSFRCAQAPRTAWHRRPPAGRCVSAWRVSATARLVSSTQAPGPHGGAQGVSAAALASVRVRISRSR